MEKIVLRNKWYYVDKENEIALTESEYKMAIKHFCKIENFILAPAKERQESRYPKDEENKPLEVVS